MTSTTSYVTKEKSTILKVAGAMKRNFFAAEACLQYDFRFEQFSHQTRFCPVLLSRIPACKAFGKV